MAATRRPDPDHAGGGIAPTQGPPPPAEVFFLKAVIFANGELQDPAGARALVAEDDVIIAADGGARHCQRLGLTPQRIIGDLDSLNEDQIEAFQLAGSKFSIYPEDKDETDLELALLFASGLNLPEVLVLGGLGRRWDHSLANLLLLAHPKLIGSRIRFWEAGQSFYLVHKQLKLSATAGTNLSLIPIGGDVHGISTEGLAWPLKDASLIFGLSRGVSNQLTQAEVSIHLKEGLLLCILGSQDGKPLE